MRDILCVGRYLIFIHGRYLIIVVVHLQGGAMQYSSKIKSFSAVQCSAGQCITHTYIYIIDCLSVRLVL